MVHARFAGAEASLSRMLGCHPSPRCPAVKTLIIAEKPSARDIVGALPGSFDEHKNFYESDDYVVTFAVGHLLELSDRRTTTPPGNRGSSTTSIIRSSSRCGRETRGRPRLNRDPEAAEAEGRRPRRQRLRRRARGRADLRTHLRDLRDRSRSTGLDQLDDDGDPRRLRLRPADQLDHCVTRRGRGRAWL